MARSQQVRQCCCDAPLCNTHLALACGQSLQTVDAGRSSLPWTLVALLCVRLQRTQPWLFSFVAAQPELCRKEQPLCDGVVERLFTVH
eukprot:3052875-Rhodomonas_salina.1